MRAINDNGVGYRTVSITSNRDKADKWIHDLLPTVPAYVEERDDIHAYWSVVWKTPGALMYEITDLKGLVLYGKVAAYRLKGILKELDMLGYSSDDYIVNCI